MRNHRLIDQRLKEKRNTGKLSRRWENNIKMVLNEIGHEFVKWIILD
jgi:hypothetical protein